MKTKEKSPSKEIKTLVLLDAHAILHRAFHALPSFVSPQGEPTGALYGFTAMILKIIREVKPDYLAACYDLPEPTFRHIAYKEYKAKRPEMDEQLIPQIDASKKILTVFNIPIFEHKGFEADDIIVTLVQQAFRNSKIIIASGDLDTLQLVKNDRVVVYTLRKGVKDTVFYNEKAVKERFGFKPELLPDFKGLKGDPSDNIIGIPGIGEKTASQLIQKFGTLENLYKKVSRNEKALEKAGIKPRIISLLKENKEDAFFSRTLAEIRKDAPISFSLKDAGWQGYLNKEEIERLFKKFGFISLLKRLPGWPEEKSSKPEKKNLDLFKSTDEESKRALKEAEIATWVCDSRIINPSIDITAIFKTRDVLLKKIKQDGLEKIFYEIEMPLVEVLTAMEKAGILIDVGYLKKLSRDYHRKLKKLEKGIWLLAGEEFNINSSQQMADVLFKRLELSQKGLGKTEKGARSTRLSELTKLINKHPIIRPIIAYRELFKLVSTYIDAFPQLVDKENRLHTVFNQTGTVTGRLSSRNPNLQNIPIKTKLGREIRRAFVASQGWKIVSADYSQMELRIIASLADDKKMIWAFKEEQDIHSLTASQVYNVSLEKVTEGMRATAKTLNFGVIYGMGARSFSQAAGISFEEAREFIAEYMSDFPQIAEFLEETKELVKARGYAETLFGRRRYLPEINSSILFLRRAAERMAINMPVQGTAADIIKMAMIELYNKIIKPDKGKSIKLLLQAHDELVFEIRKGKTEEMAEKIKNIMEGTYKLKVPLRANISIGDNWDKF